MECISNSHHGARVNGQTPGAAAASGAAPFSPRHQVAMVQRSNERGAWRSHWLASEQRYYKGTAA
jgi:hypothetical protein